MIKAKIALAAERILYDPQSGGTTIVNVLQAIKPVTPFPLAFQQMIFWAAFDRELSDQAIANFKFRLSFKDEELSAIPFTVQFPDKHIITNVVFNLSGLVVPSAGRVEFRILNNDQSVFAEYFLPIEQPELKIPIPQPGLAERTQQRDSPSKPAGRLNCWPITSQNQPSNMSPTHAKFQIMALPVCYLDSRQTEIRGEERRG